MRPSQGRDGAEWRDGQTNKLRYLRALCLAVLVVGATLAIGPVGTAGAATTAGADGIVFVDTNGNLKSVTQNGTVVDYGVDGPAAIGPAADIDNDSLREVPFVTSNGKIKIVDDEGEIQQLGDYSAVSPRQSSTKLAIGDWDEDGNYDVFFASQESNQNIYRVDWDERNSQPENLGLFDADAAQFMLGSTDITGDGVRDLVFVSSSSSLYYVNGTGNDVLLTSSTKWGSNNNIGLGEPADFDDSGGDSPAPSDFEYPRVDGSNNAGYLSNDESLTKTTYSGTSAMKAPPTAADITGDGVADHVYIGSNNGYVKYKQDPTLGGSTGTVTDSNGNELSADASIGLVGRISSFTERESITSSGKNAGDTTAPTIDGGTVAADNSYVDVSASEGLYANADGTGGLTASNLTATLSGDSDGSVTGVSVDDVTKTDGTATGGGETTVRASLSISGTPSGDETVSVGPTDGSSVYDAAGNAMTDTESTGSLSLADQQAPGDPVSTSPADDADGVATDTSINLTFGEDVRTGTGTIELRWSNNDSTVESLDVTSGTVTASGKTVTVDPSTTLSGRTDYYVTVDSGAIEDTAGNAYAGFTDSATLNFTTADVTAPSVSGLEIGADGDTLTLAFTTDEPVGDATSDLAVSVDGPTTTDVYSFDRDDVSEQSIASGYNYTLTASQRFDDGDGTYTATVDTVRDTAGNGGAGGSDDYTFDGTAPTVSNLTTTNPDARTVSVAFDSDEQLATVEVELDGSDSTNLSTGDFVESTDGSGYTYTTSYDVDADGEYTAELTTATDDAGNDGASGQNDTVTVGTERDDTAPTGDTSAPTVERFDAQADNGSVVVTVRTDEPLRTVAASVGASRTLSTDAFTETDDVATHVYRAHADVPAGEYTVTLDSAVDEAGNDGASGQADVVSLGLDPSTVSRFSLTQTGDGLAVSFRSAAAIERMTVAVDGPESATLSAEAFSATTTGDGETVYSATVDTAAPGTYNATLRSATSGGYVVPAGQSDTTERSVGLSLAPRASSYAVEPGTNVTLQAGGSAPGDASPTYAWDTDGDGAIDHRGRTVTTAFTEPDSHTVTLVATTDERTRTETLTVRVRNHSMPSFGVDRQSLNFGAVPVGERVTMNLTVSNPGQTPRTIESASLVGTNPDAFAVVDPFPVTLAPGERRALTVAFSPNSTGEKAAQLQLLSDGGDRPQVTVWLTTERSYIVVQQSDTENASVSVDAYNVERTTLGVNVSQPSTREQTVTIDELGMAVEGADTFGIDIRHAPEPPASAAPYDPETGRQSLQYVRLVHADTETVRFDNTSVTYRVDKAAVPAGTAPEDIRLSRWNGTAWNFSASGTLLAETDSQYVYRVETPGFSQFIVTGPTTADRTETPTRASGTTETSTRAGDAIARSDGGSALPLGPLAGIGGVGTLLLLVAVWRRRDDDDERDPLTDDRDT